MDQEKRVALLATCDERLKSYTKKALANPKIRAALYRDQKQKNKNNDSKR
jgi:hypothetical protein